MKIPNFHPPNQIDHPGLPETAYAAMEVLADQVDKLTTALQKNISPEDNENSETRTVDFQNGVAHEIVLQEIKGSPREVRVLDHALFSKVDIAWEATDVDKLRVMLTWPSEPSGYVTATLLVRGAPDGD